MRSRYSIKYFPFSPGIPWKVKNGKYVVPQVDIEVWHSALEGKEVVITAFGGLIESYMSLTYAESLHYLKYMGKVSWLGNNQYSILTHAQGLTPISKICGLNKEVLDKYPVPLFFDANNRVYFNCLNNYLVTKSYYGQHPRVNKELILLQAFRNSLVGWDPVLTPRLRKQSEISIIYKNWCQSNRFRDNKRFVLIFPDRTSHTIHSEKCLNWSLMQVKEFVAMLKSIGIKTVICSNNLHLYHGIDVYRAVPDISIIINLITKSWTILSEDVDYLMLSLAISEANILSRPLSRQFDLFESADFFNKSNMIMLDANLSPLDAFVLCKEL